ncbi:MAG: hypothetical protein A3K41_01095 [Chloroflexi bacterium RIFOXYD12_FULL_57_15]|nr:MAG: hypothetical protein A3K41_01095 [Chloroflexi bacterium RIFOXYD12_FULL_57_15]
MVNQIYLKVPGLNDIPRDASDRDLGLHLAVGRGTPAQQPRFVLFSTLADTSYRGDTDPAQLLSKLSRHDQVTVAGHLVPHLWQYRLESLGTRVIQGLSDHMYRMLHLHAIVTAPLLLTRVSARALAHMPDQGLAIQPGDLLHLVQKGRLFGTVGHDVAIVLDGQVVEALVDAHSLVRHDPSGDIFIWRKHTPR